MTALCKQGVLTMNVSTGNQTISGVGFQGKVVLFSAVPMGGDGSNPNNVGSFGFAVTNAAQRSITWNSQDNVTNTGASKGFSNTRCFWGITPGTSNVLYAANFVSWNSDGFVINVEVSPPAGYKIMYMVLGGTDITALNSGSTFVGPGVGDHTVSGLGSEPSFLLLMASLGTASSNTISTDGQSNCIGFATSPSSQCGSSWASVHNSDPTIEYRLQRTDYIFPLLHYVPARTVDALIRLKEFNSDGFVLTIDDPPSFTREIQYLAITGGEWYVSYFLTFTNITSFIVPTPGLLPKSVYMQSTLFSPTTNIQDHKVILMGMATSNADQGCRGCEGQNGVNPSNCFDFLDDVSIIEGFDETESEVLEINLSSLSNEQINLNQIDADTLNRQILFFSFGDAATIPSTIKGQQNLIGNFKQNLIGGFQT